MDPSTLPSGVKADVVLVHNSAVYLFRYRRHVIRRLLAAGYRCTALIMGDARQSEVLRDMGVDVRVAAPVAAGFRPAALIRQFAFIVRELRAIRPAAAFLYTARPIGLGTLAGVIVGTPRRYVLIAGLGRPWSAGGLRGWLQRSLARLAYRFFLRLTTVSFFQNADDACEIGVRPQRLRHGRAIVLEGSGVDGQVFRPPDSTPEGVLFLMCCRLLPEKGVDEYLQAAAHLKARYPSMRFLLAGAPPSDLSARVSAALLHRIRAEPAVEYLGEVHDVAQLLQQATAVVLPSYYREGVPRVLLEGLASGLPLITTDMPGCRDVVAPGVNGLLVPPRSAEALAAAMQQVAGWPPAQMAAARNTSRLIAECRFAADAVAARTLAATGLTADSLASTVLFVSTNADRAGAPLYVLNLIRFHRRRVRCVAVFGETGPVQAAVAALGVRTYVIPEMRSRVTPVKDWRALRRLSAIVGLERVSVVHVHSAKAGMVGRVAAWRLGVPCVYTVHGWGFGPGRRRLVSVATWLVERALRSLVTHYVFLSDTELRVGVARLGLSQDRCSVVPSSITDHLARSTPAHSTKVVMVANTHPAKDHEALCSAFARVQASGSLLLVGAGTDTSAFAARLDEWCGSRRQDVTALGAVDDVAPVLAGAGIFTLISRYEGLPLSVIEAMRAGLPVIVTDVGGIRELVIDGVTGLICPAGNVEAVTMALERLLRDPDLRAELGRAGRLRYEAMFAEDRSAEAMEPIYTRLAVVQGKPTGVPAFQDLSETSRVGNP